MRRDCCPPFARSGVKNKDAEKGSVLDQWKEDPSVLQVTQVIRE